MASGGWRVTLFSPNNLLPATRHSPLATIFLYERVTAGLGFSARLFELHDELLAAALALVQACPCRHGCPACVGPVLENELALLETKQLTLSLLALLVNGGVVCNTPVIHPVTPLPPPTDSPARAH